MLSINQMIPDEMYLIGDGCGYDLVTMVRVPSEEEIIEAFGECPPGQYALVKYENNSEEIIFEAVGFGSGLYIEPR
jgi:hypothetical protein